MAKGASLCGNRLCPECFCIDNGLVITERGLTVTCEAAVDYVLRMHYYLTKTAKTKSTSTDTSPISSEGTSEDTLINYKDTRNFMKERGYKRCYMCGGKL